MKIAALASVLAASTAAYCLPTNRCIPGETRCAGNVAELCGARGSFHELADCDVVTEQSHAPFVCGYVDEVNADGPVSGHTCIAGASPVAAPAAADVDPATGELR